MKGSTEQSIRIPKPAGRMLLIRNKCMTSRLVPLAITNTHRHY